MKHPHTLTAASVFFLSSLISIANASQEFGEAVNAVEQPVLQSNNLSPAASQAIANVAQAVMGQGGLTELLMQRTGVTQNQALTGAGALFQLAQYQMQAQAFQQLQQAIPGVQDMISAVPALSNQTGLGGLFSLAGNSGNPMGNLLGVAALFQQQGMSPAMVQQFIPVLLEYVQTSGGQALLNALSATLIGH